MALEITGKVLSILEPQRFTSKKDGSEIVKNFFVLETQGQYPKKIAFSVMGADKFDNMHLTVGGTFAISFDIESREWSGKWFTEASAWRATCMDGQTQTAQASAAPAPTPTQAPANGVSPFPTADAQPKDGDDDLPF